MVAIVGTRDGRSRPQERRKEREQARLFARSKVIGSDSTACQVDRLGEYFPVRVQSSQTRAPSPLPSAIGSRAHLTPVNAGQAQPADTPCRCLCQRKTCNTSAPEGAERQDVVRVAIAVVAVLVGDAAAAGPRAVEGEPRIWYGPEDWRARLDDRVNAVAGQLGVKEGTGWSKCLRARVGWRMAMALHALSGQLTARREGEQIARNNGLPVVTLKDHANHRHQIRVWEEYVAKSCKDGNGLGPPPSAADVDAAWAATTAPGFWATYRREREGVRRLAEEQIQSDALNVSLAMALQRPGGIAIGAQPTQDQAAAVAAALLMVGAGVALSPELTTWIPWVLTTAPATGGRAPIRPPKRPTPKREPAPDQTECGGPPPVRDEGCPGRARPVWRCVPPPPGHWEGFCEPPG